MILLYNNKGDIKNYNNNRGINLLSHTMKVKKRVVEIKVRRVPYFENLLIYMPGQSTTKAIPLVRTLVDNMEKERGTYI